MTNRECRINSQIVYRRVVVVKVNGYFICFGVNQYLILKCNFKIKKDMC